MKKFIALILTFIITISCTITSSFADSNLIFDILNKPTNTNSGIEVIDNILGKKKDTKVKIKIVNENTISDELESENKTVYKNNNKDKHAYIKGLDVSKWNGKIDWSATARKRLLPQERRRCFTSLMVIFSMANAGWYPSPLSVVAFEMSPAL